MDELLLLFFLVNCILSYFFLGKYSPVAILNYVWFFILCLLYINRDKFNLNAPVFTWLFYLSCTMALVGGITVKMFYFKYSLSAFKYNQIDLFFNKKVMVIYSIIPFLSMFYCYYVLSFKFDMSYFSELRATLTENDGVLFGSLGRIGQVSMVMAFIVFISKASKPYKILSVSSAFLTNLPLLSKETYILFFFSLIYFLLLTNKQNLFQVIFKIFFPCAFFLIFTMWLRYSNVMTLDFFEMIVNTYLLSSIPAFGIFQDSSEITGGAGATLRSLYLFLNYFGNNLTIPPVIYEFVATPYFTNVYTFIRPYYNDFGVIGVVIYSLLIGVFLSVLYENSIRGSQKAMVFLSLFSFPIFFSFFSERFYLWLTQWILFYVVIYFSMVKIKFSLRAKSD